MTSWFLSAVACLFLVSPVDGPTPASNEVEVDSAPADAWPSFRGTPSMTGRSAAKLPNELSMLWKNPLAEPVDAGAVIKDGVVFVATLKGAVYALSLADGMAKWKFVSAPAEGGGRDGFASSPTIAGDLLVVGDEGGTVYALDRKTGLKKWTAKTEGAIHSSPAVFGDRILIGSDDFFVYCFRNDGTLAWKAETGERVFCSPVVLDGRMLTASCDGKARLISLETGKEEKSVALDDAVASTPARVGDRLFIGTMGEEVLCLNGKTLETVWRKKSAGASRYFASPAVSEGTVVFACRQRRAVAFATEDGAEKWSFRSKGPIDSSPVIAGGRVYFGSDDGRIYGLDLSDGKKVWEYVCGERIAASPAVASGRLVVCNGDGVIFCFGAKD